MKVKVFEVFKVAHRVLNESNASVWFWKSAAHIGRKKRNCEEFCCTLIVSDQVSKSWRTTQWPPYVSLPLINLVKLRCFIRLLHLRPFSNATVVLKPRVSRPLWMMGRLIFTKMKYGSWLIRGKKIPIVKTVNCKCKFDMFALYKDCFCVLWVAISEWEIYRLVITVA